ncbi:uncharacterized protein LOC121979633 [Zingiber officinale]|uniref:uncharacterized protein LOC121979633 n=1 Tax=Zingiber officinale TaxID=94328 RepID=UPI001C4CE2EF|nr:uncharacterized protein LOC121979633 [Zingiber officinale]
MNYFLKCDYCTCKPVNITEKHSYFITISNCLLNYSICNCSVFYLLLLCHLCGHWEQYSMVVNIGINFRHSKNLAFVDVSPEELFHNERSFMNEVSKASPMETQTAKEIQTNGTVKQNASSSTEQPYYRQLFNLFKAHKDPRQNPIAYSCNRLRKTSYFFCIVVEITVLYWMNYFHLLTSCATTAIIFINFASKMSTKGSSKGSKNSRKNASGSRTGPGWEHGYDVVGNSRKVKCKDAEACISVPDNVKKKMLSLVCKIAQASETKKRIICSNEDSSDSGEEPQASVESNIGDKDAIGCDNELDGTDDFDVEDEDGVDDLDVVMDVLS